MDSSLPQSDPLATLRNLTIEQVESRLAEINGERASLSLIRRSLAARRKAELKSARRTAVSTEGNRNG